LRKLKVAQSVDGRTLIEDGLKPGERVIVAGQYKVQPGSVVTTKVANSDAAPAPAKAD
jgi:multidrug efflux system membrane fusion protein